MHQISSYEEFCNSFNADSIVSAEADLLLFMQDWFIRIEDKIDQESGDYCLDAFIVDNIDKSHYREVKKDVVSRLIENCIEAIRTISDNMRENIIRENIKMPVYKVKEINSYGLQWLSRRPGRTIREKISNSNSQMMAVRRRMSLDTGENRLYLAFLKDLIEHLEIKSEKMPSKNQRNDEVMYYSQLLSIIRDPEFEEIRRWENLPPNNTLLSDKHYKVIWKCWNELKQLDDWLLNLSSKVDICLCTLFYYELIIKISQSCRVTQLPLETKFDEYGICNEFEPLICMDCEGKTFTISKAERTITIDYPNKLIVLSFKEDTLVVEVDHVIEKETVVSQASISRYITWILSKLRIKPDTLLFNHSPLNSTKISKLIIDPFSIRPKYISQEGSVLDMSGRLMYQRQVIETSDRIHERTVPCDQSNMILLNDAVSSFTVTTAIENGSGTQMNKLIRLLDNYFSTNELTFVFPDIYNEFQLSLVHKSARLIAPKVHSFPRSIGAAFSYMLTPAFKKQFKSGDFLLIVDFDKDDLSITLVQGIFDSELKKEIPEYNGVIWERHPCISFSLKEDSETIKDLLTRNGCIDCEKIYELMGCDGIKSEKERIAFSSYAHDAFLLSSSVSESVNDYKINISDKINEFIIRHKSIIHNSNIVILSISSNLFYKGNNSFEYTNIESTLTGCKICNELSVKTSKALWRDHLPELAIKQLYGKFSLVSNETVIPEFNVEKKIVIPKTFTLPKGRLSYHFELVQSDANSKVSYEAVVKHPAFPLKQDTECRLDMIYQYGAEEPYKLLFIPVDKDAPFIEAKVSWERIIEYPYENLPAPSFITYLPWADMRHYNGKYGEEDLIDDLISRLKSINEGYICIDLKQHKYKLHGVEGYRSFNLQLDYNGEKAYYIFNENNADIIRIPEYFTEVQKNRILQSALLFKKESRNTTDRNEQLLFNFEKASLISFDIDHSKKRYIIDLNRDLRGYQIWSSKGNGYACYRTVNIDGQSKTIAFFENEFINPSEFNTNVSQLSFEISPYKDMFRAKNILNVGLPINQSIRVFNAQHIRKGNSPRQYLYNSRFHSLMITLFTGKKHISDYDCPDELKGAFNSSKNRWLMMFLDCDDDKKRMQIFNIMSLAASDIGRNYYLLAQRVLEEYKTNQDKITDYIGYALDDGTSDYQKSLFNSIISLKKEKVICILSKAVWGNEDLIKNIPISVTLEYFEAAINYLGRLIKDAKKTKDITMCLEYVLCVFRLRSYKDDGLNKMLSLNNKYVKKLYKYVETLIENKTEIHSFLPLEINNKGVYEDVPNILYALLIYITGAEGADDIKIAGLSLDDLTT